MLTPIRHLLQRRNTNVSLTAVQWAYRLILGREPSPAEALTQLTHPDLASLRRAFFESQEFRCRERALCGPSLDGSEPPLDIQDEVDGELLEKLLAHVQQSWQELGRQEPHWSVLTAEAYKQSNLDRNREQFYASGQGDAERFLNLLRRNQCFPDGVSDKTVLEYGCGVGRVTHALGRRFGQVHAYDISQPHLALAQAFTDEIGLRNIYYYQIQRPQDTLDLPKVDAVYTLIVLQHNPPPVIRWILRGLLEALKPGGVAYFQLATYWQQYSFNGEEYLRTAQARVGQVEMHALPQRRVFEIIAQAGCRVLEMLDDPCTGYSSGNLSNTFLVQKSSQAPAEWQARPA